MRTPKYVGNLPGWIVYNKSLPPAVRDTYMQLRGMGMGKSEFKVDYLEMINLTGKSRSTLYEHLRLLESCKTLRWSITGDVAILSFTDAEPKSRSSDGLLSSSDRYKVTSLRKGKSEELDLTPERKALECAYVGWLGYNPGVVGDEDSDALDFLSSKYTLEKIKVVYDANRANKWWDGKRIRPKHLRSMVPEYYRANGATVTAMQPMTTAEVEAEFKRLNPGAAL